MRLWNWAFAGHIEPARVLAALSDVLGPCVQTFDSAPGGDAVRCDVWHVGGDFPTLVDGYLIPPGLAETIAAGAVAGRLGASCLIPDDGLDPTRYLLVEPDGTVRAVHVEEVQIDDGTERRNPRPCTGTGPACAAGCGRSATAA